jgi:hypothetical protein
MSLACLPASQLSRLSLAARQAQARAAVCTVHCAVCSQVKVGGLAPPAAAAAAASVLAWRSATIWRCTATACSACSRWAASSRAMLAASATSRRFASNAATPAAVARDEIV